MKFSEKELKIIEANSLSLKNARDIADFIIADPTVGGIFPNGANGDFSNPNSEIFKKKWCKIWPVARILLIMAQIFTPDLIDKVIDKLIELGDLKCPTSDLA